MRSRAALATVLAAAMPWMVASDRVSMFRVSVPVAGTGEALSLTLQAHAS